MTPSHDDGGTARKLDKLIGNLETLSQAVANQGQGMQTIKQVCNSSHERFSQLMDPMSLMGLDFHTKHQLNHHIRMLPEIVDIASMTVVRAVDMVKKVILDFETPLQAGAFMDNFVARSRLWEFPDPLNPCVMLSLRRACISGICDEHRNPYRSTWAPAEALQQHPNEILEAPTVIADLRGAIDPRAQTLTGPLKMDWKLPDRPLGAGSADAKLIADAFDIPTSASLATLIDKGARCMEIFCQNLKKKARRTSMCAAVAPPRLLANSINMPAKSGATPPMAVCEIGEQGCPSPGRGCAQSPGEAAARAGRREAGGAPGKRLPPRVLTKRLAAARSERELAGLCAAFGAQFDALHHSALLHRCGALAVRPASQPWLLGAVAALAPSGGRAGPRLTGRQVASALWSLARLRLESEGGTLRALCAAGGRELPRCGPQELANTAWALGELAHRDAEFWDRLAAACVEAMPAMSSQHLANVSWALGRAGSPQSAWFGGLAAVLVRGHEQMSPRHLSNILWGFAQVGLRHGPLFDQLGAAIGSSDALDRWNPRDLSCAVWAYASLEVINHQLFRRVAREVALPGRLAGFGAQEIQNLAWAYAVVAQVSLRRPRPSRVARGRRGPPRGAAARRRVRQRCRVPTRGLRAVPRRVLP
ncbi:unnamed protein product [Prorocentrum cordatum]|nr:unnamed protein product [Polarella glacialis]